MTIQQIAKAFSNGQFEPAYPFLAENIQWTVVGENYFDGKKAVMENCEQTSAYFRSVTTNFKTIHIITDKNLVAISGTAEFLRDNKKVAFISACDVYEFNDRNQLQTITSYCIPDKK